MAKYSVAELAASLEHPITRQTLNDYVRRGDLIRGKDRKIDTRHPVNAAWLATRKLAPLPATGKPAGAPLAPHQTPPPPENPLDLINGEGDFDAEMMLEQVAALNFTTLTKIQVDKVHKLETLLKVRVERQHKRRELIERALVQTVFSRLYGIDVNELRTIGAKLAPAISGILGCDNPEVILAVEKVIDDEIIKSLAHIKRVMNDFLLAQGAEAVDES